MSFKDKLWRIYTGDYTDVGYPLGRSYAQQGKPRNSWGFAYIRHKNIINQVYKADYSSQTLKESIYRGYDDEQLAQTLIQAKQGEAMSGTRDYNGVLASLKDARANVKKNIDSLNATLKSYEKQINAMEKVGFLTDYTEQLKSYNGLKIHIDNMVKILSSVLKVIDDTENSILTLRNTAKKKN